MDKPLSGVRIMDFTRYLSGPFATMMLADLGATVIKIEQPGTGDRTRHMAPMHGDMSHYFGSVNRNKLSVELDLKTSHAKDVIKRMVAEHDVIVENFKPGVMDSLGLGHDAMAALNPRLIFASISGFGASGALKDRLAFDLIAQGEAGTMSMNGELGGPPIKLGLPVGDLCSGMFVAHGIMAALVRRARTGTGGHVEVNLIDTLLSLSSYYSGFYFASGESPKPMGSFHQGVVPYGPYQTADGAILLCGFNDSFWKKMVDGLGHPELAVDPRFASADARLVNRAACTEEIHRIFAPYRSEELVERFSNTGIPCGVIRTLGQALENEHTQSRGSIADVTYADAGVLRGVKTPIKFDGQWCETERAPRLGEHNALLDKYSTKPADDAH